MARYLNRPSIFEIATAFEDGKDTEGCFLPGDNYSYDKVTETYSVWNSKKKTKELFDFFDNYGHNGIKINVNSE